MQLRTIASYARELKPLLSADIFAPARSRLVWAPVHVAIAAVCTLAVARGWVPGWLWPLCSLIIGMSFAGITFLAHETLHGAVVRGKRLRHAIGWVGFLPFLISPRLWVAWHNKVHHGHANDPGTDPDANPTLDQYEASRQVQIVTNHFTPGRRSFTGVIGVLIGLSGQSAGVLLSAGRLGYLSPRQHRLAILETTLSLAFWTAVAFLVGPLAFVFVFLLPLVVANSIVMAFIFTNHGLSPVTRTNDPLANSLSVTTPRWIDWLTLGFGFHVEHHLFPAMSSRNAPELRAHLQRLWPERYQSMPLWRALLTMHRTGRVYRDDVTLADPRTGRTWSALVPRLRAVP